MRRINCVFMVTKGGAGGQGGEREERDGFFIMIAAHVIVPLLGGRERCVSVRGKMKQKMPGMPLVKEADIVPYSSRQLSSRCCGGGSSVRSQEPRSDEERTGSRRDDTSLSPFKTLTFAHTHTHARQALSADRSNSSHRVQGTGNKHHLFLLQQLSSCMRSRHMTHDTRPEIHELLAVVVCFDCLAARVCLA